MIGSLGNIVFETSSDRIRTFDDFTRESAANFAEHRVLDQKPRLQHTGLELDKIKFSVRLDAMLGVIPSKEIENFQDMLMAGESQKLIVGGKVVGDFVLLSIGEQWTTVDAKGCVIVAVLDLSLKEYV